MSDQYLTLYFRFRICPESEGSPECGAPNLHSKQSTSFLHKYTSTSKITALSQSYMLNYHHIHKTSIPTHSPPSPSPPPPPPPHPSPSPPFPDAKTKLESPHQGNSGIEPEAGLEPATLRLIFHVNKSHTLYRLSYPGGFDVCRGPN